jgi:hypothetical protein
MKEEEETLNYSRSPTRKPENNFLNRQRWVFAIKLKDGTPDFESIRYD